MERRKDRRGKRSDVPGLQTSERQRGRQTHKIYHGKGKRSGRKDMELRREEVQRRLPVENIHLEYQLDIHLEFRVDILLESSCISFFGQTPSGLLAGIPGGYPPGILGGYSPGISSILIIARYFSTDSYTAFFLQTPSELLAGISGEYPGGYPGGIPDGILFGYFYILGGIPGRFSMVSARMVRFSTEIVQVSIGFSWNFR